MPDRAEIRRRAVVGCLAMSLLGGCPRKQADEEQQPADEAGKTVAASMAPVRSAAQIRREGNHLLGQPSPYLEQHAHNPVDWYPWGTEALDKARREHKPIFLSIGYSTCHWCHVMEEESFEDDEVAAFLNEHFVAIKVDREQRPDIDAVYIDAVAALGASTGWPLTVFLTPDLEPFYGGTYFPRHAGQGRPGFLDVLREVETMWREQGDAVAAKGRAVLQRVQARAMQRAQGTGRVERAMLQTAMDNLGRARDPVDGGFGRRQKFPNSPLLLAELRHVARTGDEPTRQHLVATLEAMMHGGIRDHVGGTFHRYAVDPRWHVPHFEKTLYDNAQLGALYIEAGRALDRNDFVRVGRKVLDDLVATWQRADGGFIVGYDADDPNGEGAYYTWTPAELVAVLGKHRASAFATAYGVDDAGDPGLDGRSVLHLQPDGDAADFAEALDELAAARVKRPAPAVDDKELVGWNGLAVMALADAGRWLDEPRYIEAARRAGAWILDTCLHDGVLARGSRGGERLGDGFLEDYALAGLALVRLHAATGEAKWLIGARALADAIAARYYDAQAAAFLQTRAGRDDVPVRRVDFDDGALPSGGSAATLLMFELGALAGESKLRSIGERVLGRVASTAAEHPTTSGFILVALDHATASVYEVVIAGPSDEPATLALWSRVRSTSHARILPARIPADGPSPQLAEAFPALDGKKALRGRPTAFVCELGRCQAPTSDPHELAAQLAATRRERGDAD